MDRVILDYFLSVWFDVCVCVCVILEGFFFVIVQDIRGEKIYIGKE